MLTLSRIAVLILACQSSITQVALRSQRQGVPTATPLPVEAVAPEYPPMALASIVQGVVSVRVRISDAGVVLDARAIDGPALLRKASVNAARHWTFGRADSSAKSRMAVLKFKFEILPRGTASGKACEVFRPPSEVEIRRILPKFKFAKPGY